MKPEDIAATILKGSRPQEPDRRGWSCPSESRIAAFAEARLTGRALEQVRAHVANCRHCLETVAFLVRIDATDEGPEVPPALIERARQLVAARPRAGVPRPSWATLAAATTAAAVVVAIWLGRELPQPTPVPPPSAPPAASPGHSVTTREATPAPTSRSAPVAPRRVRSPGTAVEAVTQLAPAPGATLAREELEFRWTEVKDALYYEVRIVTHEGDLVWETRTRAGAARPPEAVSLVAGERYFARILAVLRDGRTAASPARPFSVQGR